MTTTKKSWFVLGSVTILLMLLVWFVLWGNNESTLAVPVKPANNVLDDKEVRVELTKWVYNHSKQISMANCKEIVEESMKTNKPLLLLALIEVESNYVPTAVSSKGALGLTQVMPNVHEKTLITKGIIKEKRDLFDIAPSIRAGNYVLDTCLSSSKGDVSKALEGYLGGQDKWYVNRILANLANLYLATVTKNVATALVK